MIDNRKESPVRLGDVLIWEYESIVDTSFDEKTVFNNDYLLQVPAMEDAL